MGDDAPRYKVSPAVHYINVTCFPLSNHAIVCDDFINGTVSTPASNLTHDVLRRSSSSSSSGSSADSGFEDSEKVGIKDETRREQNKVAAFAYRQRIKSVSELAEVEYNDLLNHNKFLLEEKSRLELQITKIRQALERLIRLSKEEEEEEKRRKQVECSTSHISIFKVSTPDAFPIKPPPSLMVNQSNEEKIRKKEQNRIASKRFRERRRIELSRCKEEALHYETSNNWLRLKMAKLEDDIAFLRDLLEARNIKVSSSGC